MPDGEADYARASPHSSAAAGGGQPGELAIRQFDVQLASGTMHGFVLGGTRTNSTRRGTSAGDGRATAPSCSCWPTWAPTLRLRGESPLKYSGLRLPLVRFTAGDQVLAEFKPDADFDWSIEIPAGALPEGGGTVTLSLDRAWLPGPAEGTADKRRLGLRIFETRLEEHVQSALLLIDTQAIGD